MKFLLFGNDGFSIDAQNKLVSPPDSDLVVRKPLQAFIPDARHAILAAVLVGNASLDTLAEGSAAVQDVMRGRTFENATVTVTGTPTFLTDINDYLQGGMLVLGGIAVLVMMVILLVAFKVRWRLLPLRRHGRRHRLGLRCLRIHRHEAVAGDDRRPADPHRPRHRVRDPDPEPDRGGTRASSIRAIRSR